MANTYSQSYFHIVFAVKNRNALIQKSWKFDLEKYITGIIQNHKLFVMSTLICFEKMISSMRRSIY